MTYRVPDDSIDPTSDSDAFLSPLPSPTAIPLSPVLPSAMSTQNIDMPNTLPGSSASFGGPKIPWPKWDGTTASFLFFLTQLKVRVKTGCNGYPPELICYHMIQTLPPEKQRLVGHWFENGGPDRDYDWKKFADHFSLQFENKQAKKAATEELSRMRQGSTQYFTDYVSDFEYKLAIAGGIGWPDEVRLSLLQTGINTALKTMLVSVSLPDDKYDDWMTTVKIIAGKMESLATYRPNGSTQTKTWFLRQPGSVGYTGSSGSGTAPAPRVDAMGDTIMGGSNINAIVAAVVGAMNARGRGNGAADGRPRAAWKTKDVFSRLMERGLCIRCEKSGHMGRNCPEFRAAANPGRDSRVAVTATIPAVVEEADSENE